MRIKPATNRHTRQRQIKRPPLGVESLEDRHLLAGDVFVTGHDVLDHQGQNGYDFAVLDYLRGAGTNQEIPASEYSIAVLGTGEADYEFSQAGPNGDVQQAAGYQQTAYFDVNNLVTGSQTWSDVYRHNLMIVTTLGSGNLEIQSVPPLTLQADAVATAVRNGMDVWANSSSGNSEYYGFLSGIADIESEPYSASSGVEITEEGIAIGLRNHMLGAPLHNAFTPNPDNTVLETRDGHIITMLIGRAEVRGRVWNDANSDGIQDQSEEGVAGVAVRLLDSNLEAVATSTTDVSGDYFINHSAGQYYVEIDVENVAFSPIGNDNDINAATQRSDIFDMDFIADGVQVDAAIRGTGGTGSIASYVWQDDGDGIRQPGEDGLAGVPVTLLSESGANDRTETTAADGSFEFTDVAAGNYRLQIEKPVGYALTRANYGLDDSLDSDIDPSTSSSTIFTVLSGQADTSRAVGLLAVESIGGRVWEDINGDGMQQLVVEPGLEGVRLDLSDANGAVVASAVSDQDGNYVLEALAGEYRIRVHPFGAYAFTQRSQGVEAGLDSDVDPIAGMSGAFTLGEGDVSAHVDVGLAPIHLEITEFMAINRSSLENQFHEFHDWIEIANTGAVTTNLSGWHLTDRRTDLVQWTLPDRQIAPGEHTIIYASGSGFDDGVEIHVDFKLSGSGEYLGLVAPDGQTIVSEFAPTFPQQVPDVSYGRSADGRLLYYPEPTPGEPNNEGVETIQFHILITEFMAENHTTLTDQDGDYADWIEIHNAGETPIELDGYYLTDQSWDLQRWKFPDITMQPGEFRIIFASGNDLNDPDGELHTNFKLGQYGEYLALVDKDGQSVLSEFDVDRQQSDVSYGLSTDFRSQRYFDNPTPGSENAAQFLTVDFSHPHGFYDQPFPLTLSTETPDAVVMYTTDGSDPTATNGTLYAGSFEIAETTTLRAAAILPGQVSTVFTRTYFFANDILTQTGDGQPQTWGFITDYEMDPDITTDPQFTQSLIDSLQELPSISIVTPQDGLYDIMAGIYSNPMMFVGDAALRDASIEVISGFGTDARLVQTDARISIETNVGHLGPPETPKLPIRIDFDSSTSVLDRLEDTTALVLHAGYEDSWIHTDGELRNRATYTRDEWLRESQDDMGQSSIDGRFVHLYLNGQYWGVYNAIEAPTADAISEHLGGDAADYDVLTFAETLSGDRQAWDQMFTLANSGADDPAVYDQIRQFVDVENLADFIILNEYAANRANPTQGWYAARRNNTSDGFKFFVWDGEVIFADSAAESDDIAGTPRALFNSLAANQQFRRTVSDRIQKHLFNGGALTHEQSVARLDQFTAELGNALLGESARWGDYRRDGHRAVTGPFELMVPSDATSETQSISENFLSGRSESILEEFRGRGLYPQTEAPVFNQHGGVVDSGFALTISAAAGNVFFTTNGSDVLLPDGSLSPAAQRYESQLEIDDLSVHVSARAIDGDEWSALVEATFLVSTPPPIVITELMYHPAEPNAAEIAAGFTEDDGFEFIEIKNIGDNQVTLDGMRFDRGIHYSFTGDNAISLAAGEHAVLVSNKAAFEARYGAGINVVGEYSGKLNNGGEHVTLSGSFGETIADVKYSDRLTITDGGGFSLLASQFSDGGGYYSSWMDQPSALRGGSPGDDDPQLEPGSVVINEIMALPTNSPNGDWIELHNTTDRQIDISGWFLTDKAEQLQLFEVPDETILFPGGYVVFYQSQFGFGLNRDGEDVFLSSGHNGELAGYRTNISYERAEIDVSYGRHVTTNGEIEFLRLEEETPGEANSQPLVGPVVISEIMYNPSVGSEYIELTNISDAAVLLDGWRLTGIGYDLDGASLAAGESLVVIGGDPAQFRTDSNLPPEAKVLGPWNVDYSLDNGGESITLFKPDDNGEVRADRIQYDDDSPWSSLADGRGASLGRIDLTQYGNDPANWVSSIVGGTPTAANESTSNQPQPFPSMQGFEVANEFELAGWDVASDNGGVWEVTSEGTPFDGGMHLKARQTTDLPTTSEAVMVVDLSGHVARTDLAIDFYMLQTGSLVGPVSIDVSGNRGVWAPATTLEPQTNHYTHYAFDLDAALTAAGIEFDADIYVRFTHTTDTIGDELAYDNVRLSTMDFFPPNVIAQTPQTATSSFDSFNVTFDDPIDAATFSADDVTLVTPTGRVIQPSSISSGDSFTWTIAFPAQSVMGSYRLSVGPNLADTSGNLMSQGGTAIDGQTVNRRAYESTIELGGVVAKTFPHIESFEDHIASLDGWSFSTTGAGTWDVTADANAAAGSFNLSAGQVASAKSTNEAVLLLNLADQADANDLSLDFWVHRQGHATGNFGGISISGDRHQWITLYGIAPPVGVPTQYVFDLDEVLDAANIAIDEDVYLRFEHTGSFVNDRMSFDAVRIANADLVGPHVVSFDPPGAFSGALTDFSLTLSESIDTATFTMADLAITGPDGKTIALAGDPIDSGDAQTFTALLASPQTLNGMYRVSVGPNILDLAGNAMNEDRDPTNGELNGNDTYLATLSHQATAEVFPYTEDFAAMSLADLSGWSFSTTGSGVWEFSDRNDGMRQLTASQTDHGVSRQDAVLVLDLADQNPESEIYLDFWASSSSYDPQIDLLISDDGDDWKWLRSIQANVDRPAYYAVDLAAAVAAANVQLDSDVHLMFSHTGISHNSSVSIGQFRVSDIDPFGPKVITRTPIEEIDDARSEFYVTFDDPVQPASFTTDDVQISLPFTSNVHIESINSVDDRTFQVIVQTPRMSGWFDLTIGPDIFGADGIPMNQDGDTTNGEVDDDLYRGEVFVAVVPVSIPYTQGFESGSLESLSGWVFRGVPQYEHITANWLISTTNAPNTGNYHLDTFQNGDCWTMHDAILAVDVSGGHTNLVLEFDLNRTSSDVGSRNMGKLFLSGDAGATRVQVGDSTHLISQNSGLLSDLDNDGFADLTPNLGEYTTFKFDLGQMITDSGLAESDILYVNIHQLSFYPSDHLNWDNIRIYEQGHSSDDEILGRHLVYRNSNFDTQIVPNKTGLLPGDYANETSISNFSQGINSVVVDVVPGTLPDGGQNLRPADFRFRVADSVSPSDWQFAPQPIDISTQTMGDRDRVTIIWSDEAIREQWLQVTFLAGPATGLAQDDVFYFANLPGDANSDGRVDAADFNDWYEARFNNAEIADPADFNRDGVVDVKDFNVWNDTKFTFLSEPVAAEVPVEPREPRAASSNLSPAAIAVPTPLVVFSENSHRPSGGELKAIDAAVFDWANEDTTNAEPKSDPAIRATREVHGQQFKDKAVRRRIPNHSSTRFIDAAMLDSDGFDENAPGDLGL